MKQIKWSQINEKQESIIGSVITYAFDKNGVSDLINRCAVRATTYSDIHGKNPSVIVNRTDALADQVKTLVRKSRLHGWTSVLVSQVKAMRHQNGMVEVLDELVRNADELVQAIGPATNIVDAMQYLETVTALMRATCHIEIRPGQPRGSGVLVGERLVLTNFHVMKDWLDTDDAGKIKAKAANNVFVRFDFTSVAPTSQQKNKVVLLAENWLVSASHEDDLDYALIRLGASPQVGAPPPIVRDNPAVKTNRLLIIMQHPRGKPMSLSIGTSLPENLDRLRYSTATEAGSSGAGVYTFPEGELVALHHAKQKASGDKNGHIINQGIPIRLVQTDG